jgi:A/G-specific adenine glycosylase
MKNTRQLSFEPGPLMYSKDDPDSIREFQTMVLRYYQEHGRDLAWRNTSNPYHILVSEIMLQQTQVDRVALKYPRFLEVFPDFSSLADTELSDILREWQGLGYNRRAIALRKCACRVVAEFEGHLPADVDILATFPGIGRATASSICAFAFNQPVVFIETNIRRVFIHFFFGDREDIGDAEILPLVSQALDRENPCRWYNALMDLGTNLRTKVPNPNRRSRHYLKQSAFEGSDRKIRGEILRLLLSDKRLTGNAITGKFSEDPNRIHRILKTLAEEGFIRQTGSYFIIATK